MERDISEFDLIAQGGLCAASAQNNNFRESLTPAPAPHPWHTMSRTHAHGYIVASYNGADNGASNGGCALCTPCPGCGCSPAAVCIICVCPAAGLGISFVEVDFSETQRV